VLDSWWWTVKLSETCEVLFLKYIWEISASRWCYYKNISRCTVTWMSKALYLFVFYSFLMFCARDTNMNTSLRSYTVHTAQIHSLLHIHCSSTRLLSASIATLSGLKWDGGECIHVSVSSFICKVKAYISLLVPTSFTHSRRRNISFRRIEMKTRSIFVVSSVMCSVLLLHKQSLSWTLTSCLKCQFPFVIFE